MQLALLFVAYVMRPSLYAAVPGLALGEVGARLVPASCPALSCADAIDEQFPLGPQLRVLAADVESPKYRKLVTEDMLATDLAAEWQRVETEDNPESFVEKHGGRDKVLADPQLRRAYERRVAIREKFLDLMRDGYRRYKQPPPFDHGEKAE